MTEIKLWIDGSYVHGHPDYGAFYDENNKEVYITDYNVPLTESIERMIEHVKSEHNKIWRFKRKYYDKKHDCMVIVVEEIQS